MKNLIRRVLGLCEHNYHEIQRETRKTYRQDMPIEMRENYCSSQHLVVIYECSRCGKLKTQSCRIV